MRTYKLVTVPATTRKQLDKIVCDLCGATGNQGWRGGGWERRDSEVSIAVKLKEGYAYPEGSMGSNTTLDICPECFESKLIPWFVSQGGKPIVEDVEFG
jgi:hypothetical protein